MKVLITGGAGFIGSHIAECLQEEAEVRILDNLKTGKVENLNGITCELIQGSILDANAVKSAMEGVDYVFHLAAMVSVPESMSDPIGCNHLNVLGLLNVLEAASKAKVKKLCFSSSAAIYGNNPSPLKQESLMPDPRSPYAITKLDGEYYCDLYRSEGRLETAALRYFNVYGPRQDLSGPYAAAIPNFINRALKNEPIVIYGDGTQTRDFVFVKDVASANRESALNSNYQGVFNVGCSSSISIMELAMMILKLTNSNSRMEFLPKRPGDVARSMACTEKIGKAGFKPRYALEQSLIETIEFYSQQLVCKTKINIMESPLVSAS